MTSVYVDCNDEVIHENGYWQGSAVIHRHRFDAPLADAMVSFFTNEETQTIVDFGCGRADYLKHFLNAHFYCEGYDGNPVTYEATGGVASVLDLSKTFDLGKRFDWVVSLEVGEHIPECYETTFIRNLDRHVFKGLILSWAVKGQGGFGHFNEQNNDYIKNIIQNLGYVNDVRTENFLRLHSTLPWFKNTIMVFRKLYNCAADSSSDTAQMR